MAGNFTIDLAPDKSIAIKQSDKKPCEDYRFRLLPGPRIIDTEVARGSAMVSGCKAP